MGTKKLMRNRQKLVTSRRWRVGDRQELMISLGGLAISEANLLKAYLDKISLFNRLRSSGPKATSEEALGRATRTATT